MEERLFSYGTLQLTPVQLSTFGRILEGQPDVLCGYRLDLVKIEDPAVIATSGKDHHPIITHTGNLTDTISGTAFIITADELEQADAYEVDDYKRVSVELQSGKSAWVYVSAG
jgi:gamma-glutamylcyclotransferase (GGCT)/AIG2-like uncharacterized protein YtfP